ncbi:ATP-binding protein [Pseudomarimonas arenosa]|nr:ATP-binding protein [Pseudomarimonas arenosa]
MDPPPDWSPCLDSMRSLTESLPIATCLRGMSGELFHVNTEFQRLTGIQPQSAKQEDYAWLSAEAAESARNADRKALHGGATQRGIEQVSDQQTGRRVDCQVTRSPVRDAKGQICGLALTYSPTQSAETRRSVPLTSEEEAAFAAMTADAWLRCDLEGRLLAGNPICARMLNLDFAGQGPQSIDRIVAPAHRAKFLAWLSQVAASEQQPQRVRMRLMRRDETEFAAEIIVKAVAGHAGITELAMTVRDIDEHHELARALEESNGHLRRLRRRLELAVRGTGYGIWEFDLRTGRVVWDPQMYVIHGQSGGGGDFDGSPNSWLQCIHPDDRARMNQRFSEAQNGRETLGFIYRIRRFQPSLIRFVESNAFAERDDHGEVIRLVGMDRDVTGRVEADMELKILNTELENLVAARTHELLDAKEHAEAASRAKSEFLANISHELRTPLHSILGFAKLSLEDDDYLSADDRRNFLQRISASGGNLLRLVNDLLDSARIEAERFAIEPLESDLVEVVNGVLDEFGATVRERQLRLQISLPERAELVCDPARIAQAVRNLLSNACKFAPADSELSIRLDGNDRGWALRISDQGPGVPDNEREKIFDKFTQSSITKTGAGGAGLGLPIARGIARLHGGDLYLEECANGARFLLQLPLSPPSAERPGQQVRH